MKMSFEFLLHTNGGDVHSVEDRGDVVYAIDLLASIRTLHGVVLIYRYHIF